MVHKQCSFQFHFQHYYHIKMTDFSSVEITWYWISLFLILLGSAIYWFFWNTGDDYWKTQNIPYVPNQSSIRELCMIFLSNKGLHVQQTEKYKKYGRIFGTYQGKQRVLSLADPELIRVVFIKDFQFFTGRTGSSTTGDPIFDNFLSVIKGEQWKRVRTIITPAFSTGKIKRMADIFFNSAKSLVQSFAEKEGVPVDSKKLFQAFTMDIIASTAFATKLTSYKDPNNKFIQEARKVFTIAPLRTVMLVMFPWIMRALHESPFDSGALKFFKENILNIIEERQRSGKIRNDFLQLLIDAEKEGQKQEAEIIAEDSIINSLSHEENNPQYFETKKKYKSLSRDELIAQCVIFLLAGFETTAATLTYVSFLLALNPEIQEKLFQEVDAIIRSNNGKLTYESIQDMKYMDSILAETLRMFPPAIFIERVAEKNYKLENTGIVIEKGTHVNIPVYSIHHDPEFYPEPEKFKPERFSGEKKAERNPYTFLAFGAGPRNCIGMRFALIELKIGLAYLISQFKIKRCSETKVPIDFVSMSVLLQPKEVIICVEKRGERALHDF